LQVRGIGFSFVAVASEKKHPEQHSSNPENGPQTF
jgi:hypothetical protein